MPKNPPLCGACGIKDGRPTVKRKKVTICVVCACNALANHLIMVSRELGGEEVAFELSSSQAEQALRDLTAGRN